MSKTSRAQQTCSSRFVLYKHIKNDGFYDKLSHTSWRQSSSSSLSLSSVVETTGKAQKSIVVVAHQTERTLSCHSDSFKTHNGSQSDENSHIVKFLFIHWMRLRALIHKRIKYIWCCCCSWKDNFITQVWWIDGWIFRILFSTKISSFFYIQTEKGICVPSQTQIRT